MSIGRKIVVSFLVAAQVAGPAGGAAAADSFYYRSITPIPAYPLGDGGTQPPQPGTDSVQGTGELVIFAPLQVRARVGVPFSLPFNTANAKGGVAWTLAADLPAGLAFAAGGILSGTPQAVQQASGLVVEATDGEGRKGQTQPFTIDVRPVPSIAVAAVSQGKAGEAMSVKPSVTETYGSQTWRVSGTLPVGLQLNARTGEISGTPMQSGTFAGLTLSVMDSDGAGAVSEGFTLQVQTSLVVNALSATYGTRKGVAVQGIRPYATGTPGPFAWSLAAGELPAGLSLDAGTGAITGTPSEIGTVSGLALAVRDSKTGDRVVSREFAIRVGGSPVVSVPPTNVARVNTGITVVPTATDLIGGGYWSVSGYPPAGMDLSRTSGRLEGVPTSPGTASGLAFQVIDLFDGAKATSQPFSVRILPDVKVGKVGVPGSGVGIAFSMQPPPVTGVAGTAGWTLQGTLPPGLSYDPVTHYVTGTPTKDGSFGPLRFNVTDSHDSRVGVSPDFGIRVLPEGAPLGLAVTPLTPDYPGRVGRAFDLLPQATGANGATSWELVGAPPPWLTFDAATGRVGGVPDAAGTTEALQLRVRDGKDVATSNAFAVTVEAQGPISLSMADVGAVQGQYVQSAAPALSNAVGASTFSLVAGSLPEGVLLDPSTGRISGTPVASGTSKGIVLQAIDGLGYMATSAPFAVTVTPGATASTAVSASLVAGPATVGNPYLASPSLLNAADPVTWSVAAGTLPSWASMDATTGRVSGTPDATGIADGIVLRVVDAAGRAARTEAFSIATVAAIPLQAAISSTFPATLGARVDVGPTRSGGSGAGSWTLAGDLPSGLAFEASTGRISGTATATGTWDGLRLTVTDAAGASAATDLFAIAVSAPTIRVEAANDAQLPFGTPASVPAPPVIGGVGAMRWSLAGGTLPSWASLDGASGTVSGRPDALAATTGLRLRATDTLGTVADTNAFSIAVTRGDLSVSVPDQARVRPGAPVSIRATVAGAIGATSFALAGTPPAGLSFDAASGTVSGIAPDVGTYGPLAVTATDAFDGANATSQGFAVEVVGDPSVSASQEYQGTVGSAFSAAPLALNVIGSLAWTVASGTLPAWASLDPSTGVVAGSPPAVGRWDGISLRVTDSTGATAVSAPFALAVSSGMTASMAKPIYFGRAGLSFGTQGGTYSGGTGPLRWSVVEGTLPGWATLDTATGLIAGMPDGPFTGDVRLRLDRDDGYAVTPPFRIQVEDRPHVAVKSVTLREGAYLALAPLITSAYWPFGVSVTAGKLPRWVTVKDQSWVMTGRAAGVGPSGDIRLTVSDYQRATGVSEPFSIDVVAGPKATGYPDLVAGRAGMPVSVPAPSVSNALGNVSWSGNGLPSGLALAADGSVSGTPSGYGTATATLTLKDDSDGAVSDARLRFDLARPLAISGVTGTETHVGMAFGVTPTGIVGQRGTLTWSVATGNLPPWATLNTSTGVVSGLAPSAPVTVAGLSLKAADSVDGAVATTAPFSLRVAGPVAVVDMPVSFSARFGFPFTSGTPTLANAIGRRTWSLSAGTLPSWARLDPSSGVISGLPDAQAVTAGLRITGSDSTGASAPSVTFGIAVYAQPEVTLPTNVLALRVGDPIALAPSVVGVVGTPTWSLVTLDGTPPAGLAVDPSTGAVTGTAAAVGNSRVVLRVTDGRDGATTDSQPLAIQVSPALALSGMRQSYSVRAPGLLRTDTPQPTGALGNLVYSLSGTIPSGTQFDTGTGVLSGVATSAYAPQSLTLTAKDPTDGRTVSFAFTVGLQLALDIGGVGNVTLRNGTDAASSGFSPKAYNLFYAGSGSWKLGTGSLPAGVTVDAVTGALRGKPSGFAAARDFENLFLVLTDTADRATATSAPFTVTVNPTLSASVAQAAGTVRAGSALTLPPPVVSGLVGAPSWAPVTRSGSAFDVKVAPDGGLTVSPSASAAGTWTFVMQVRDGADGASAETGDVTVTAVAQTRVTYAATTPTAPGNDLLLKPGVTGNLGQLAFSVASGRLPNGVTLAPDTGWISGQPTELGVFNVVVSARDADGFVASSGTVRISSGSAPDVFVGNVPQGKVGRPFSLVPTVSNSASTSWSQAGTLPSGLAFSNGRISGTPTATGTAAGITVTATDMTRSLSGTSDPFSISVVPGNSVQPGTAPAWRQGLSGAQPLALANGVGTATWRLSGGALPAGLAVDPATGAIAGRPAAAGTYSAQVQATDAEGTVATATVPVTVAPGPAVSYVSRVLTPQAQASLSPSTNNLNGVPTFRLASGTLPDNMALAPDTGVISGTPAVASQSSPIVIEVIDADGAVGATKGFTLSVSNDNLLIDTVTSSLSATVGSPFSYRPAALLKDQVVQQYLNWALIGTLPDGLAFDTATGTVSGTPGKATPSAVSLRFKVTYGPQTATSSPVSLSVADRAPLTASLPQPNYAARKGAAFSVTASQAAAVGNVTWSIVSGSLPPGTALSDATGTVSGVPSTLGTYTFTLQAADSAGRRAATGAVSVTVTNGMTVAFAPVTTGNRVGKVFLSNATVDGNAGAVTWTLATGPLPPGIALNAQTGSLSGTPTGDGTWKLVLRATDGSGASVDLPASVTVGKGPTLAAVPTLNGAVGQALSYSPVPSNVAAPAQWSSTGTLPQSVAVDPATGKLSGTPNVDGTFAGIRLTVTDADGLAATTAPFTVAVSPATANLAATMPPNLAIVHGQQASFRPTVTGTTGGVSYLLQSYGYQGTYFPTGNMWRDVNYGVGHPGLPAGLTYSASTGVISGVPSTGTATSVTYRYLVTGPGGVQVYSNQFSFAATDWLTLSVSEAPVLQVTHGQPASFLPTVTNAQGGVTYQLQSFGYQGNYQPVGNMWRAYNYGAGHPGLPPGLAFNPGTGEIYGTPSSGAAVTTPFRIVASDGRAPDGTSNQFTFDVREWGTPTITLPQSVRAKRGDPVNVTPSVADAQGNVTYVLQTYGYQGNYQPVGNMWRPYNYGVGHPGLPPGLAFNPGTGVISGTTTAAPSASPTWPFRIVATDGRGVEFTSNQMSMAIDDWTQPTVSVDQTVTMVRGTSWQVTPTTYGTTGAVSYALQSFGYQGTYFPTGNAWRPYNYGAGHPGLPSGLVFDAGTGIISGTPTTVTSPSVPYALTITDGRGMTATSGNLFVTVVEMPLPTLTVPNRTDAAVGTRVSVGPAITDTPGTVTSVSYALSSYGYQGTYFPTGNAWRPYNYGAGHPGLPSGLVFDAGTGIISGNLAVAPASVTYRLTRTETRNGQANVIESNQFSFGTVTAAPTLTYPGPNVVQAAVNAAVGAAAVPALSNATAVTGGYTLATGQTAALSGQYGDTVASTLPGGLSLDPSTGAIVGTPNPGTAGTYRGYRVCAPTASGQACTSELTVRVADRAKVAVEMPAYPTVTVGQYLSAKPDTVVNAVGAVTYGLSFAQAGMGGSNGDTVSNALPPGLSFNAATGEIYGTASAAGNYRGYVVTATDRQGSAYAGKSKEIVIRVLPQTPLTVTAPSIVDAAVNVPMATIRATASGAVGAVNWAAAPTFGYNPGGIQPNTNGSIFQGSLPAGLAYGPQSGTVDGTVLASATIGTYRGYRICATDGLSRTACSDEIAIRVANRSPLVASAPPLVRVKQGGAATIQATVAGAVGTLTWNTALSFGQTYALNGQNGDIVSNALPPGLAYQADKGLVSGTVANNAQVGRWRGYKACVRDSQWPLTCTDEIVVEVVAADPLAISMAAITDAPRGTYVSIAPSVSGVLGTLTWDAAPSYGNTAALSGQNGDIVTSALPATMTYNKDTGAIEGTVGTGATQGRWRGYRVCGTDARGRVCSDEAVINVR